MPARRARRSRRRPPNSAMDWRSSADNPQGAVRGREAVTDGDSGEQAERDRYWQEKMHAERLAHGVSGEDEANYVGQPEGPAAGVAAELRRIDPSGLRQVSLGVDAQCAALGWRLEHLGTTIGTVIHGPELGSAMSEDQICAIYAVLTERKVVCFREQTLSEAQHVALAQRFGTLEVFPFSVREGAAPTVMPLKSVSPIAGGASSWHSDVTWRKTPSLGSILYCEVAPAFGGSTGFMDCYAAWQGLPASVRAQLRGKCCIHDFDVFRKGQRESGVSAETLEQLRLAYPVARHPICRTHPDTGGEMLYVNRTFGRYIEERAGVPMAHAASEALLESLYAQAHFPEFQCFFKYETGSLAFWDNRACMHRATVDFSPYERTLRRITIAGTEPPFYTPPSPPPPPPPQCHARSTNNGGLVNDEVVGGDGVGRSRL